VVGEFQWDNVGMVEKFFILSFIIVLLIFVGGIYVILQGVANKGEGH
jgi:hypothetical protein